MWYKPINSNFIATLRINYCNDSDIITTVFFLVINNFCFSECFLFSYKYIDSLQAKKKKKTNRFSGGTLSYSSIANKVSNLKIVKELIRFFVSARAKIYVYFSIRTYFFYFIYSLFKTSHIRLYILHYILLKY